MPGLPSRVLERSQRGAERGQVILDQRRHESHQHKMTGGMRLTEVDRRVVGHEIALRGTGESVRAVRQHQEDPPVLRRTMRRRLDSDGEPTGQERVLFRHPVPRVNQEPAVKETVYSDARGPSSPGERGDAFRVSRLAREVRQPRGDSHS